MENYPRRVPPPQAKEPQVKPQQAEEQQPPTPLAPPQPTVPDKDTFNDEMAALAQSERKRLQMERDHKAALARLQQYADEHGLAETEENVVLVKAFLDEKVKGYWSVAGVDAAIANLRSQLKWRPKVTPVPQPPPAEPVQEVLEPLPNGDPRLPLDASQFQMVRASVEQLRDLDARRRASKPYSSGWHGAKF
jgi:hypothetical protein